jgi:hypothetical protein
MVMKVVEKMILGTMFTLAVGGLLVVVGTMILGELDFSNFPKGTYILSMKDENGNFITQKILKK